MSVKRSTFRAIAVALAAFAVAGTAPAKAAKKKDKNSAPDKNGGMMEDTGKDPAQTETLENDEGDFVPGKKKKESQAAQAAEGSEIGASASAEGSAEAGEQKPKEKELPPPRKTIGVFAEGLLGIGSAPLPGPLNPDTNDYSTGNATAFAIQVGGHYDFTPEFRLMLRVPFTIGTVKLRGTDTSTSALGNPELAARLRLSKPGNVEWAVRLGVGVPVAQGQTDYIGSAQDTGGRAQNYLQRVADASDGWHDQELYALKRIPITPALLFSYREDRLRIGGEFKTSIMPKIGGTITSEPGGGTLSLSSVAWNVLLGGSVSYEVFTHAHVALAAWARYGIIEQIKYDLANYTEPSRFQLALEPKVLMQFGHVVPSVGFVVPVASQLGGEIWGLRLHVDVIF